MFTFPKKFHNFATTDEHISLLNCLNSFDPKPYNDLGISIKVSFETKEHARVILRKDSRKVDFQIKYGMIEFINKIKIASELF